MSGGRQSAGNAMPQARAGARTHLPTQVKIDFPALRSLPLMTQYFDAPQLFSPQTHPALREDFVSPDASGSPSDDRPRSEPMRSFLFGLLGRGTASPVAPIPAHKLRHVLLLRYDALGDYLVTSALTRWIKHHSPACRISVISSYRNDGAMRFDPFIDRRLSIDPRYTFHHSWLSALSLRREAPIDLVIAPIFTRLSKAATIARLAAPGTPAATFRHPGRAHIYGKAFQYQAAMHPWREHISQRMLNLGRSCIDSGAEDSFSPRPHLSLDVHHARQAAEFARRHSLRFNIRDKNVFIHGLDRSDYNSLAATGRPYIVFNIASHMPERNWSVASCIDVIKQIQHSWPELVILLSGGPQRREDAREICAQVNADTCLTIEHDWLTFCALVAGSEFLISVDSAPVHVASASGRPAVVLVHKYRAACEWYPFGIEWRLILSPSNVHLNDIPSDLIFTAVTQLVDACPFNLNSD